MSKTISLHFIVPPASVKITTKDDVALNFGESVTLECTATVVRGVTSGLHFQWLLISNSKYNETSRRIQTPVRNVTVVTQSANNGTIIYKDFLTLPPLKRSHLGNIYICEVEISNPKGVTNSRINYFYRRNSRFMLNFPGKIHI